MSELNATVYMHHVHTCIHRVHKVLYYNIMQNMMSIGQETTVAPPLEDHTDCPIEGDVLKQLCISILFIAGITHAQSN